MAALCLPEGSKSANSASVLAGAHQGFANTPSICFGPAFSIVVEPRGGAEICKDWPKKDGSAPMRRCRMPLVRRSCCRSFCSAAVASRSRRKMHRQHQTQPITRRSPSTSNRSKTSIATVRLRYRSFVGYIRSRAGVGLPAFASKIAVARARMRFFFREAKSLMAALRLKPTAATRSPIRRSSKCRARQNRQAATCWNRYIRCQMSRMFPPRMPADTVPLLRFRGARPAARVLAAGLSWRP